MLSKSPRAAWGRSEGGRGSGVGVERRSADFDLLAAGNPGSPQPASGWHPGHPPRCPLPTPAFDCSELRVAEQINFLHTSLCAGPRPSGPPARPRPGRQLDWAINLRGPRAPAGPGLCAVIAGRGPGRPPGLLALIRAPAPPPLSCGEPGRAVSHPVSAPPRPLGSVHLSEPRDAPPAAGLGEGSRGRAGSQHPSTRRPMCQKRSPLPETRAHTRAHTRGGRPIKQRGNDEGEGAAVCAAGEGGIPAGAKSGESLLPPTLAPQVWRLVSGPSGWGWGGREREREGLWEFARHFRLFVSFLGLCQKLTPLHHALSYHPHPQLTPPPAPRKATV